MTVETIIEFLLTIAPALAAMIGSVIAVMRNTKISNATSTNIIDKFEDLRAEVFNSKEYEAVKDQLTLAHQEHRELVKKINELMTVIDKIQRESEEE